MLTFLTSFSASVPMSPHNCLILRNCGCAHNAHLSIAAPMVSPLTLHHPSKKRTTIPSLLSNSLLDCFPTGAHIPLLYQVHKVHLEKEQWTPKKNKVFSFYLMFPNKDLHELQRFLCSFYNISHPQAGENPTYAERSSVNAKQLTLTGLKYWGSQDYSMRINTVYKNTI